MRFSICAVDRDLSPDMPFPLRGRSYGECAEMAEKLGFDGIELQIQDPAVYRGSELRKILDDHGIAVSAVTTGLAYTLEGLSMTHPDRGMRKATVERLKRQLDLARELDSQILIGYLRGRKQPGQTEQEFEGILTESLGEVVEYGASIQAPTVFEQINRRDGDVFNTTERTMEFLEKFHSPWLLYNGDTYHMATEDPDVPAAIRRSLPKLKLFHVSDHGRLLPDDRHFNFREAAEALKAAGYSQWVSIECKPLPDSWTASKNGVEYLRKVFR